MSKPSLAMTPSRQLARSSLRQLILVQVMTPCGSTSSLTTASASTATAFYAGAGADQITVVDALNVSIFADSSSADTAGGADSISLGGVTSSTVYGAAGSDTLDIQGTQGSVYVDLGADANRFEGAGVVNTSTLIGGAANDTFSFSGVHSSTSIVGGAGDDTFSTSAACYDSTLLGGAGNDTATFTGVLNTDRLTAVLVSP